MVPLSILFQYHPTEKAYTKDQVIFREDDPAKFYYQIKTGRIKMMNLTAEGKEFVQGFFKDGQSFGEPPLLGNFNYPASAVATKDTSIYVLPEASFLQLLKDHTDIHLMLTANLSHRIHYKAMIMKEISVHNPEHRIESLLNHLKSEANATHDYEVKLTRQQISELTGLRVETVIRAIKKLEKLGKVHIVNRKVYL